MAKKQKEYKYSAEYKSARRNLLRNVRSLEKRGYDVSAIKIPKLVSGRAPKLSDVRALKRANDTRYDKATKVEEVRVRTERGIVYENKTVSGKFARYKENVRAGKKGEAKRSLYRSLSPDAKREYKELVKYEKKYKSDPYVDGKVASKDDFWPFNKASEWFLNRYAGVEDYGTRVVLNSDNFSEQWYDEEYGVWHYDNENPRDVAKSMGKDVSDDSDDYDDSDYSEDSSYQKFNKKDYNKINKPSTPVPAKSIAEEQKQRDTKLANVLADLAELANLTGLPKGKKWASMASTIQNNAQQIMDQMIEWAKTDPDAFFSALNDIEKGKGFSTVEVVYQRAGVDRYLQKYKDAMNYYHKTQDYNEDTDAYIEQDYDED
jgi:hypothetical protein